MPPINATFQGYPLSGKGTTFTRTPGLSPNANAIFLSVEGAVSLTIGSMVISDGAATVTLTNQYAEEFYETYSDAGREWRGMILDKRWRYRFGQITGEHNPPTKDGEPTSVTSLRALAILLLDAMGEAGYDVSSLPTTVYPHVRWEAAVPADEMNRLLQEWGYVLVLNNNNTVKVWKLGVGVALPAGNRKRTSTGQKRTRKPSSIIIRGGRSIVQRTFELIPYGLDTDGAYKPLPDLSYAPDSRDLDGGFGVDARNEFRTGDYTDEERKLASESVFRVYGLDAENTVYLPWLNRIVETVLENGKTRPADPIINGMEEMLGWDGQKLAKEKATASYTLDLERGLVKFAEMAFGADDEKSPVSYNSIWLAITVAYQSVGAGGVWTEADFYSHTTGAGDPVAVHKNDKLILRGIFNDGTGMVDWQNQAALDAFAAAWAAQLVVSDDFITSEEIEYAGIVDINCDGRIRSVTWSDTEAAGATTVATLNTERAIGRAPTYHERTQSITVRRRTEASQSRQSWEQYADSVEGVRPAAATPSRQALPYSATDRGERRTVINASVADIPAHGAVEFDGWDGTAGKMKIKKPTSEAIGSWAVTDGPLASGDEGQVFVSGHHFVAADPASDPAVAAGQFVGPQVGSHLVAVTGSATAYVLSVQSIGGQTEALVALGQGTASATRFCAVTVDHANGTYHVKDLDDAAWTAEDVPLFELPGVDYFAGTGVGRRVLVVGREDGWAITVGWATLMGGV